MMFAMLAVGLRELLETVVRGFVASLRTLANRLDVITHFPDRLVVPARFDRRREPTGLTGRRVCGRVTSAPDPGSFPAKASHPVRLPPCPSPFARLLPKDPVER